MSSGRADNVPPDHSKYNRQPARRLAGPLNREALPRLSLPKAETGLPGSYSSDTLPSSPCVPAEMPCSLARLPGTDGQQLEQQQRMKAGGLEVPVAGTLFPLSVHLDFGGIHVQDRPITRVHSFRFPDQRPVESCQSGKVLVLGQPLRLKALQARGQRRSPIPDLFGTDQPEGRVPRRPLRVVESS